MAIVGIIAGIVATGITYETITKNRKVIITMLLLITILAFTIPIVETQRVVIKEIELVTTGIASYLVIMTTMIIPICIMIDSRAIRYYIIIEGILVILFVTNNILVFYIMYEAILIPMYMIISKYGKSYNKYYASKQFIIYTIAFGLVMLVAIGYIYVKYKTLNITYITSIDIKERKILGIAFLIGFLVKIPVVPIQIWLPAAHTESSTSGSVILAAIIIKIATYGIIRIVIPLMSITYKEVNSILIIIYTISIVYTGLTTIKQIDLKKVVAYSSIAHMNYAMLGTTTLTTTGIVGCIIIMISHAFISGAMFTIVGSVYTYTMTRKIPIISGLSQVIPVTSIMAIIIFFANMSIPCLSGFVGEYVITIALIEKNMVLTIISSIIMIITTIYSLGLYTKIFNGEYFSTILIKDMTRKEVNIMIGYIIWIIIIGIDPSIVTAVVDNNISKIMNNV